MSEEEPSGYKLLLTYNIKPDDSQAYYEFVLGRYIPIMQAFGMEVSEAWHTSYGDYPNRLVGFVCRDRETLNRLLADDAWDQLNDQLLEHVTDFSYKIIPYQLGFQF